ncbi:alpha/beta fold hydrolase [Parafrankia sp. EUN1f]|uniref:alpha/beta fold hydrolase n=1 Tax=Parafrankia sp. EUN1f TaxID=102897 RepID=UPI0001C46CA1|nr:alpha/beta fold hydrolase [Parafrankia sp. EUN1f]EFC80447.1 putative esterase/lipase [Parafrankia sp. EUN1f]
MDRQIPLFTLEGVPGADVSIHPFSTADGLGLSMLRFTRGGVDVREGDSVLVLHGLTTSSDMFIMPEHQNLVRFLLANDFGDVWLLDYRMSNRFPYNRAMHRFNLDDVALYDHPAAVRKLREVAGSRRLHVISHCLGSMSFLMSLFGGVVDGISSVVANSVALTPRVATWSRLKLAVAPNLCEWVLGFPYLDPAWADRPRLSREWLFAKATDALHRECDVSACHMLSLMWGTGRPALWQHDNLLPVTHERSRDLFGATGLNYYRHIRAMVSAGHAVKYRPGDPEYARLPDDYLADAGRISTPMLLVAGDRNHVFTNSNIECWRRLEAVAPGRHELDVIPGYGHQDVFMGKNVDRDVFPRMLDFIKRRALEPVAA